MSNSSDLRSEVELFVAAASQPALLDPGEEPFPLIPLQWGISEWNGRLVLQAWNAERNLVRKIVELKEKRHDRLAFITERFPKARGEMQIADLAAPQGVELRRKSSRVAFRDRFRLMLNREFPDWRLEEISSDPNLEQSLSPSYIRAFLSMGSEGIAAMAAPPDAADSGGVVPFGLIWLDYLRRREKQRRIGKLLLYSALRHEREASIRAALIAPGAVVCRLFVYDDKDRVGPVDFTDAGNIESTLPACRRPVAPNSEVPVFPAMPDVETVEQHDGSVSLRVRGLEFARWSAGKLTAGIGKRKRATIATVAAMAREVARVRNSATDDRQHPLYAQSPEGWLESQVRANPQAVDASLMPVPVYGQVPIFGGSDRGIIDLLGVDYTGRLSIIELKAAADPQLPFQALDYWLRVRKHLHAGDFEALGYFPGIPISKEDPRILLVAPALEFHSTTEATTSYLSRRLEITRIGLAADWRRELRVMFRLRGSDTPL